MPKNLILLSDGTGNQAGKLSKTNVWRVYQALDLKDSQDLERPRQFACYDDGVGTSSFKPWAMIGGAFGVGLSRNVRDLYVFLCRMYEPGDRIYAFGFSRGAFTIRVLVGLVMTQGLLRYRGSESELQRLAADAYRAYRAQRFTSHNPLVFGLRKLRDTALHAWNALLRRTHYSQAERIGQPDDADPIKIEFVGLWDTVDAYGLPVDELTWAIDKFIWPLTMRDYNLNPRVSCARHALAIDDERKAFHPRLWNEEPQAGKPDSGVPGGNLRTGHIKDERISQVWFAGVHANVGGGYPDDSLSYVPLKWIVDEASRCGLRFEAQIEAETEALSDENGLLYDSRRGLAGYYRYQPRRIDVLAKTKDVEVGRTKVHESVLRRIKVGHDGYAPITLPPGFAVVKIDGSIIDGDAYLQGMKSSSTPTAGPSGPFVGNGSKFAEQREQVFNWVWRRRVAYFATLGLTLALLAMPLMAPGTLACDGAFCFVASPIAALGWLLPSFASVWTDSWSSHPDKSLPLLILVFLGLRWGSSLERRICDLMRRVWYAMPPLRPASPKNMPGPMTAGLLDRAIQAVRGHALYRGVFLVLTRGLLPLGFLAAVAYAAVAAGLQLEFARQASKGSVCGESTAKPVIALSSACAAAGVEMKKGATYKVRIEVPSKYRWWDNTHPAGPNGFECRLTLAKAAMFAAGVPLRRHPSEPWFQPMARIGSTGNDTYALHGVPQTPPAADRCDPAVTPPSSVAECPDVLPAPDKSDEVFESLIVARSDGPLFFYVNDAIGSAAFYANNSGCARVTVSPVLPAPAPSRPG